MLLYNCDLFKRTFTNKGIGFGFNNEEDLIRYSEKIDNLRAFKMLNNEKDLYSMKSAGFEHSLKLLIESNLEEARIYEKTKLKDPPLGDYQKLFTRILFLREAIKKINSGYTLWDPKLFMSLQTIV